MAEQQKALFLPEKQGAFALGDKPIPFPGPGELLLKVEAVGLNPLDWKLQKWGVPAFIHEYPAVLGEDIAGTVESVGEGVSGFAKGDRVIYQGTFTPDKAGFQQYTLAVAQFTAKIPSNISLDEGATLPTAVATAAMGLYAPINDTAPGGAGLTAPWEAGGRGKYAGKPILVLGGSSSVGQMVIQFAKLSGFSPIITTASQTNQTLVNSLGATHLIDRALPAESFHAAVSSITTAPLEIIYNTISTPETQQVAYDLLAPGGAVVFTLPLAIKVGAQGKKRVINVFGAVAIPSQQKTGAGLYAALEGLLANGELKPNPVRVLPGGLNGVVDGLREMEEGRVSGYKLIVHPQETGA
ncbi:GroES-like protein [Gloeophyllum trabeum ATCC 11539]|uniref:GroES-like protein n=1 Tax=Gloeophyllum trabeum (strain ATCC 11539 / FP-39264 / Madison 617) TaxID=670483 RepID=S7Q2F5_GLOTA|nr:GroES-like protein [Gloeophyllum trabeum ATCC 11539]EPQ54186.1 GroES-like protein [Gloeophyllum trabeum ATCC 11539]